MQLGKKFKIIDMFECVKIELGLVDDVFFVLVVIFFVLELVVVFCVLMFLDWDVIYVIVNEVIIVKLFRDGVFSLFFISGDLILCVLDLLFIKFKFNFNVIFLYGVQFWIYLNVDKNLFNSMKVIQMVNMVRGFFVNNVVGVLCWRVVFKVDDMSILLIVFIVWVNKGFDGNCLLIVEYELLGGDEFKDVSIVIFYQSVELFVVSFDVIYEVFGDSFEWFIGIVNEENFSGVFEFEVQMDDENEFFFM